MYETENYLYRFINSNNSRIKKLRQQFPFIVQKLYLFCKAVCKNLKYLKCGSISTTIYYFALSQEKMHDNLIA